MKIIIILITLIVFLNLVPYFASFTSLPGYIFFFLLMLLISAYYLIINRKIIFNKELMLWVFIYITINAIYYMFGGMAAGLEYKRFTSVIMIGVVTFSFFLLYSFDDENLTTVRKAIVLSMVIAVLLLIYDFIFPGHFILPSSHMNINDRAVATYINQNIVGAVLILSLILSIDLIPKAYKMFYVFYIFLGISLTFSRSNIIIYFIILFVMALQNKVSRISVFVIYILIILFLAWLMFWGLDWVANTFNIIISDNLINRLNFFLDNKDADTSNLDERKMVLKAALEMFMNKPILGNGFASTITWHYKVGPHNTFALTWAEFVLIGLLFIPTFLLATTYRIFLLNKKEYRDIGILFIVYFSLSSMFSHNMLEQSFNYVGAVIIALIGYKNFIKEKSNNV